MPATVVEAVLASSRFRRTVASLALRSVMNDFQMIEPDSGAAAIDWNDALPMASALTGDDSVEAQDGVLRVAQGCLVSEEALDGHRDAAAVLLERVGNLPAINLAVQRDWLAADAWTHTPPPLQFDVVRRRLELTIPLADGKNFVGNQFQREFWSAASTSRRLSVSAPTSAGKSFVVRQWLEDRLAQDTSFRAIYVVPTRALIDEVSADLRRQFVNDETVGIFTIPWDQEIDTFPHEILVMTQERLHLVQHRLPDYRSNLLFVDEAQKFGDGQRGVLLQQVVDESERRDPKIQVIFASPLASNPELLLEDSKASDEDATVQSQVITVNQNLLWADQMPGRPKDWSLHLVAHGEPLPAGTFALPARPTPDSKRLPFVAVALGGLSTGNVVYVNGAADAEKAALQIFDALGSAADRTGDQVIADVRDLVRETIHPQYALVRVLERGIGFHYGNMPLLVRGEIERLFRDGLLRYLVCTSTLLEGVNLPCRNLYVRGPKKGRGNPMTAADFWNLAGRAGRWGKEFQGNIICIDAQKPTVWPEPPRIRERQPLVRATDDFLARPQTLIDYIEAGAPVALARREPLLESMYSYLVNRVSNNWPLADLASLDGDEATRLEAAIRASLRTVELDSDLIARHAGIGPLAMQRTLTLFRSRPEAEILLAPPESYDATSSYVTALDICNETLGADFGEGKRQFALALLITQWMRGLPLARIITGRISYYESVARAYKLPNVIRDVMADIEQEARFKAPKYLACYRDILAVHLRNVGRVSDAEALPDVAMMLELGVSRDTEVSLMALGLSRTSVVALSTFITADSLAPSAALIWLRENASALGQLPALVRREIDEALERNTIPGGSEAST